MTVNWIITLIFAGVVIGYISGIRAASKKQAGIITLDTRNDDAIHCDVHFCDDARKLLNEKYLTFRVNAK